MTRTTIDGIFFMDPNNLDEDVDFSQVSITTENKDTLVISIYTDGENKGVIAMEKEDALHLINVLKSYTDTLVTMDTGMDLDFLDEE